MISKISELVVDAKNRYGFHSLHISYKKVIRSIRTKCAKGSLRRDGWMEGGMEEGMEGGRKRGSQGRREGGRQRRREKGRSEGVREKGEERERRERRERRVEKRQTKGKDWEAPLEWPPYRG